jgi:hypothetical protein
MGSSSETTHTRTESPKDRVGPAAPGGRTWFTLLDLGRERRERPAGRLPGVHGVHRLVRLDLAQARGSTTIEFAVWSWVALLGWLVVVLGILGVQPDLGERYHGTRDFERSGRHYGRCTRGGRVPSRSAL